MGVGTTNFALPKALGGETEGDRNEFVAVTPPLLKVSAINMPTKPPSRGHICFTNVNHFLK